MDLVTDVAAAGFGPLPPLGELLTDQPRWVYPSACAAGSGQARLRVWAARGMPGLIAAVTELGRGASITNSAEMIWKELLVGLTCPLALIRTRASTSTRSSSSAATRAGGGSGQSRTPTPAGPTSCTG